MVRAKMKLAEIKSFASFNAKELIFRCQYDPSLPEDQRFAKYTPSGEFRMQFDNPAVLDKLTLGNDYYVDFSPVPEAPAVAAEPAADAEAHAA
jgi:hypothetical protein